MASGASFPVETWEGLPNAAGAGNGGQVNSESQLTENERTMLDPSSRHVSRSQVGAWYFPKSIFRISSN